MKRFILIMCLFFGMTSSGCTMTGLFGKRVQKGNEGQVAQEETLKSKSSGNIQGKIVLPHAPVLDNAGKPLPNQTLKIDGIETSLPAGSTGILEIEGDGNVSASSLNSLLSKWKLNSALTGLIVFGAVLIAVGCILIYLGAVGLGVAALIAGFSLIGCSVLVEKYPLVILGIVLIGIIIGIYFVYHYFKTRNASQVKEDSIMVIARIAAEIEKLPKEVQEQIKENLKKDDNSATIKQIVAEAKKL
jgi:hypothetical protein